MLGAQPEYLSGLRGPMIREFLARGHEVIAIGAEEVPAVRTALENWGARYVVVPIRRAGLNPVADFRAIIALHAALKAIKPDILFTYTLKPNIYGLPIGRLAGVSKRFGMVAGRGWAFGEGDELRRRLSRLIATWFFRFAFRFADGVISQNEEDLALFHKLRILRKDGRTTRIFGSGVDLEHYKPQPMPAGPKSFVMICRLLADKGVADYVEAARALKRRRPDIVCRLIGPFDHSPNGIRPETIARWVDEGIIEYLGSVDDVRPVIAASHVLVLPSKYGEGVPRTVLEAMAMARPVITTDTAGCRDTVRGEENGRIVPPGDIEALTEAMAELISDDSRLATMGEASLLLARERFDVRSVNAAICRFMELGDERVRERLS